MMSHGSEFGSLPVEAFKRERDRPNTTGTFYNTFSAIEAGWRANGEKDGKND